MGFTRSRAHALTRRFRHVSSSITGSVTPARGESGEECLRRELREELGIDAEVGTEVWRTEHVYPGRAPVALRFFAVPAYRGVVENRAFAEVRWVRVAELARLDFLAADRGLIDRLVRGDIALS